MNGIVSQLSRAAGSSSVQLQESYWGAESVQSLCQDQDGGQSHVNSQWNSHLCEVTFRCVPDINKCEPSWKLSCRIYIDCQNLNKSYRQCRGNRSLSQVVFENECTNTCSGKKESILSFPLSWDLATYSKPERSVLSIYWYPLSLQTPRVRTSHRVSFLQFWNAPLTLGILFS